MSISRTCSCLLVQLAEESSEKHRGGLAHEPQIMVKLLRSLLCMEVLDAAQQLYKAAPGIFLIVASSLQQRVQQLSSCEQLCDEVHLPATQTLSRSLRRAARFVMSLLLWLHQ